MTVALAPRVATVRRRLHKVNLVSDVRNAHAILEYVKEGMYSTLWGGCGQDACGALPLKVVENDGAANFQHGESQNSVLQNRRRVVLTINVNQVELRLSEQQSSHNQSYAIDIRGSIACLSPVRLGQCSHCSRKPCSNIREPVLAITSVRIIVSAFTDLA